VRVSLWMWMGVRVFVRPCARVWDTIHEGHGATPM